MEVKDFRLSVVIPLYNNSTVIGETLASALSQTVQEFELIVVDDGSTDGGASLVEAVRDVRVRLIRQPNLGVSAARNRGVLEARGEWIAFLDADDLWATAHLENLALAVRHTGVIGAFINLIYESLRRPLISGKVRSQRVDDYFSFALANGGYPMSSSSVLLRRDRLVDAGLFAIGEGMGEDIDMWCRFALLGRNSICRAPFGDVSRYPSFKCSRSQS